MKFELEKCQEEESTTSLCLFDLSVQIKADGEATFDFYTKAAKSGIFLHKQSALPWSHPKRAQANRDQEWDEHDFQQGGLRREAALQRLP